MTFYSHKVSVNRIVCRCDCTVEYFYLWMFLFVVQYFPFVTLKLMNVREVDDTLSVCTPLKHGTTLTDLKNLGQIHSNLFRSWLSSWLFWFHDPAFLCVSVERQSTTVASSQILMYSPYIITLTSSSIQHNFCNWSIFMKYSRNQEGGVLMIGHRHL